MGRVQAYSDEVMKGVCATPEKQRTMKKLGKALVLTLFLVAIALAYVAIELGY